MRLFLRSVGASRWHLGAHRDRLSMLLLIGLAVVGVASAGQALAEQGGGETLSPSDIDRQIYALDYTYAAPRSLIGPAPSSTASGLDIGLDEVVGCAQSGSSQRACGLYRGSVPDVAKRVWLELKDVHVALDGEAISATGRALVALRRAEAGCRGRRSEPFCRRLSEAGARYVYYVALLEALSPGGDQARAGLGDVLDLVLKPIATEVLRCRRADDRVVGCEISSEPDLQLYAAALDLRALVYLSADRGGAAYLDRWIASQTGTAGRRPSGFVPVFADSRMLSSLYHSAPDRMRRLAGSRSGAVVPKNCARSRELTFEARLDCIAARPEPTGSGADQH